MKIPFSKADLTYIVYAPGQMLNILLRKRQGVRYLLEFKKLLIIPLFALGSMAFLWNKSPALAMLTLLLAVRSAFLFYRLYINSKSFNGLHTFSMGELRDSSFRFIKNRALVKSKIQPLFYLALGCYLFFEKIDPWFGFALMWGGASLYLVELDIARFVTQEKRDLADAPKDAERKSQIFEENKQQEGSDDEKVWEVD